MSAINKTVFTVTDEQLADAVIGMQHNAGIKKLLKDNEAAHAGNIKARIIPFLRSNDGEVRQQSEILRDACIPATVGRLADMVALLQGGAAWSGAYAATGEVGNIAGANLTAAYNYVKVIRSRETAADKKALDAEKLAANPEAVAQVQEMVAMQAEIRQLTEDKKAITQHSFQQDEKVRSLSATVAEQRELVVAAEEHVNRATNRAERAEEGKVAAEQELASANRRIVELETQVAQLQSELDAAKASLTAKKASSGKKVAA